jgi:two-component system, sensor histidine kinase and response regulator
MRAVREDPAIARTWLIAASAPAAETSKRAQHSTHADMWLARPIRPSQLLQSLNELLVYGRCDQVDQGGEGAAIDSGRQARQRRERTVRVLVVEDNAINQKLALNQLRKLGYAAEAIDSGPGALEILARGSYAAVLMDCQMPRMDGYATTAEIRRRESGTRHTIIIAMTAISQEGARERCLAAGMDDYMSKPVRLEALEAALSRWIPLTGTANTHNGSSKRAVGSGCESIDPEVITELLDLSRSCDSGDFLGELIKMFYGELASRLALIREAASQGQLAELDERAHELKGSCLSLGLGRMATMCGELEALAREGSAEGAQALLDQIEREARVVRPLLEAERSCVSRENRESRAAHPQ